MFVFPATPRTAAVHCVLMAVQTSGPPYEGRLPFPRNLSMKIISGSCDFGTTGQRRPSATSWHKNEFHVINIEGVINLQTSPLSFQLLPAQRRCIVC